MIYIIHSVEKELKEFNFMENSLEICRCHNDCNIVAKNALDILKKMHDLSSINRLDSDIIVDKYLNDYLKITISNKIIKYGSFNNHCVKKFLHSILSLLYVYSQYYQKDISKNSYYYINNIELKLYNELIKKQDNQEAELVKANIDIIYDIFLNDTKYVVFNSNIGDNIRIINNIFYIKLIELFNSIIVKDKYILFSKMDDKLYLKVIFNLLIKLQNLYYKNNKSKTLESILDLTINIVKNNINKDYFFDTIEYPLEFILFYTDNIKDINYNIIKIIHNILKAIDSIDCKNNKKLAIYMQYLFSNYNKTNLYTYLYFLEHINKTYVPKINNKFFDNWYNINFMYIFNSIYFENTFSTNILEKSIKNYFNSDIKTRELMENTVISEELLVEHANKIKEIYKNELKILHNILN